MSKVNNLLFICYRKTIYNARIIFKIKYVYFQISNCDKKIKELISLRTAAVAVSHNMGFTACALGFFFISLYFTLEYSSAEQICHPQGETECPSDTCCSVDECNRNESISPIRFKCCANGLDPNDALCSVCPTCGKILTIKELFIRPYFV